MKSRLKIKELAIVLVGHFNPIIYHPHWMARKDLVSSTEADAAKIKINHPEVSEFEFEYCSLQVLKNRFTATSAQETHFKKVKDLVRSILDCLPECPIAQVGINLHHHYDFEKKKPYVDFGHKIVPKEALWKTVLDNPGVLNIAIKGDRDDDYLGYRAVYMNVSNKVQPYGVRIHVNDHYELYSARETRSIDSLKAIELLDDVFISSTQKSEEIIKRIHEYGSA